MVSSLNCPSADLQSAHIDPPLFSPQELNYLINPSLKDRFDAHYLIARLTDGSRFQEFKKGYGETLVCGFAELYGQKVGIVANNGVLFPEAALKGAHFVELCSQRKVPLLFL